MGLHLVSFVGVLLAIVGAGMLGLPRLTRRVLVVVGVRWRESEYDRIAAWLLIVLGLAVALVGRAAR